jgi:tetratricopeptide (TPR) repeat protein
VATPTPPTGCRSLTGTVPFSSTRKPGQPPLTLRFVLAGLFLGLTGCGGFVSQQRNVEGVGLFQQGQYPEALREFQEATYSNPKDADGYYNIAATYHRMGRQTHNDADLKQAEKFYNDCLDRNANHVECHRGLAVLLAEQGQKDASFRLLQNWVDREPTLAEAKVELARLHDEFGNRQAAKDCLIEALEAQPDNVRALTALGKIRDEAGDKVQALANYQRSLLRDNRQPQVASRVNVLQGGQAAAGAAGAAPDVLAPPAVEKGTLVADRSKNPLQ